MVHYLCFLPLDCYPQRHLLWTSLISTVCPNYQEDAEPTRHSTLLLHCISLHCPQNVGHSRNCHNTATSYGLCIVYIYSLPLLLTPSTWLCETLHTNWRAYILCLVLQTHASAPKYIYIPYRTGTLSMNIIITINLWILSTCIKCLLCIVYWFRSSTQMPVSMAKWDMVTLSSDSLSYWSLTYTCRNFSTPIPKLGAESKVSWVWPKLIAIITEITGSGTQSSACKIYIAIVNVSRMATVNNYNCCTIKTMELCQSNCSIIELLFVIQ